MSKGLIWRSLGSSRYIFERRAPFGVTTTAVSRPPSASRRSNITSEASAQIEDPSVDDLAPCGPPIPTITLAWIAPSFVAVKGIVHMLCAEPAMKPECRNAILAAIAKARGWVDHIRLGCIGSFAKIAENEALGERHIRLLARSGELGSLCSSGDYDQAPKGALRTGLCLQSNRSLPHRNGN